MVRCEKVGGYLAWGNLRVGPTNSGALLPSRRVYHSRLMIACISPQLDLQPAPPQLDRQIGVAVEDR